jgi:hypothetical protein
MMPESEFVKRIAALASIPFREDFETALYDLYQAATPAQRAAIRQAEKTGRWQPSKPWRNPADYERLDLTREQRMRQHLIAMSIRDGGKDYRDDFLSIGYCYFNLAVLGVDADGVLDELAKMSAPKFAELVRRFGHHALDERTLKGWGMEIVQKPGGPVVEITRF